MEIESENGSKIQLDNNSDAVFGRGLGFDSDDRTVSRRHVLFQLQTPPHRDGNQTEPRVLFQVIGKNPIWVKSGGEVKVFRNSDTGEAAAGDCFCLSGQNPSWFHLKMIGGSGEEEGSDLVSGNLVTFDVSQIDPVKEFGFIVIGHEFDCYGNHRIRDVKNWDWFLEDETEPNSEEEEGSFGGENKKGVGRRKRKEVGGNGEDDDDWTGESEEDKEIVSKTARIGRPKYLTRSKDPKKPHKDSKRKKSTASERGNVMDSDEEEDENDDTLGGFIVKDDEDEKEEEQLDEGDDEEEEFIDDDDEEELED